MKRKGNIAIAVICVFVGVLIILQMKTVDSTGGSVDSDRARELAAQMAALESENETLTAQLDQVKGELESYETGLVGSDEAIQKKQEELNRQMMLAGFDDAGGPGLLITVDVDGADMEKEFDAAQYSKTAEHLLALINELNSAGAEAISINGERIIATTEIRQAGNYININRAKHGAPFEVKAIGNPDDLSAALKMRAGIVDIMNANRLKVTINKQDDVYIEAYKGTIDPKYAQPTTSEVTE